MFYSERIAYIVVLNHLLFAIVIMKNSKTKKYAKCRVRYIVWLIKEIFVYFVNYISQWEENKYVYFVHSRWNNILALCIPNFISISLPPASNAFKYFIWNLL